MKGVIYISLIIFLCSFYGRQEELAIDNSSSSFVKDSLTFYFFYKASSKKVFYCYYNDKIVYKAQNSGQKYVFDSVKVALDSSDKNFFLPLTLIERKGKKSIPLGCQVQNLPGYRCIYIEQDILSKKYLFDVYYYKSYAGRPRVID